MALISDDEFILDLKTGVRRIRVRVSEPRQAENGHFRCDYEMSDDSTKVERHAYGATRLQAVLITLCRVADSISEQLAGGGVVVESAVWEDLKRMATPQSELIEARRQFALENRLDVSE